MKTTKIVLAAVLIGASGLTLADYSGSREDRMQHALADYRNSKQSQGQRDTSTGPAARTEESMKRGAHNAGQAIKHGAQKVGHAVSTGLHKTGQALSRAGSKLKAKSSGATSPSNGAGEK